MFPTAPPSAASAAKASEPQLENIGEMAAALVRPGDRVGLGSGKAALAFVRMLGRRVREEKLDVLGLATSILTEKVATEAGVPLGTVESISRLNLAVDGADEIDPNLDLIKGGGGNLLREKVVARMADRFVIVVGGEKRVNRLGERFPVFVEVVAFALPAVVRDVAALGGKAEPRKNPDGTIFLTDNNNPLLHCTFPPEGKYSPAEPAVLDHALRQISGTIETGLFIQMATEAFVANADGSTQHLSRV